MKKILFLLFGLFVSLHAFGQIRVYDDAHRLVNLSHPATRIITLSPNANDILQTIKAKRLIVGTIIDGTFAQQFNNVPKVGKYTDPDQEKILSLKPDLVVMPKNGISYGLYIQLAKLNIPIFVIDPKNIHHISEDLIKLGVLTGQNKSAEKASNSFIQQIKKVKKRLLDRKKITVFYELWDKPLMTVGNETMINQVIKLSGGKNIFNRLHTSYSTISLASVIAANPQVIIVSDKCQIAAWKQWPMLQAVQKHHIVYMPSDLIQHNSPRILQGVAMLSQRLD